MTDIAKFFDRVVVINLKRRPDRLRNILAELKERSWPFIHPEVFNAVDGNKVPVPKDWQDGGLSLIHI